MTHWTTADGLLLYEQAKVFWPTRNSLVWFVRLHRPALIERQAVMLGGGRRRSLFHVERMLGAVEELLGVAPSATLQTGGMQ